MRPSSSKTRTMVASNLRRGWLDQLGWKGGSSGSWCWLISMRAIFISGAPLCGRKDGARDGEEIVLGRRPRIGAAHRGVLVARHLGGEALRRKAGKLVGNGDLDPELAHEGIDGGGKARRARAEGLRRR